VTQASGVATAAGRYWGGPRRELVARVVRHRLPPGCLVVDAAWHPDSPLSLLGDAFRTLAVARGPARPPAPAVEAHPLRLPVADASVDSVLLLDVLERLDDDRAALAEAGRACRAGGMVLATVPAGPRLWSPYDERAGHRRRYTAAGVAAAFVDAGLVPESVRHFQFLLFPLFVASRRRARRRPHLLDLEDRPPPWVGRVLEAVNRREVAAAPRVALPWGSSVLAVGRRP
jgi:SAM-dependent methyltransferase